MEVDQKVAGTLRVTRDTDLPELRLEGEFDATQRTPFLDALADVTPTADGEIHLDLGRLRFLDLGALNLLVRYAKETDGKTRFVLHNIPPDVDGLIESLGWERMHGLLRAEEDDR
ncbi:STAS domain-containing protein [Spirillospora sp. NPDC048819]|uniref:STAS domain-containing protein n=1 Tax=Spirillospora sp. NPDC048819 TaxID=3155268 RepID=UPI0033C29CC9